MANSDDNVIKIKHSPSCHFAILKDDEGLNIHKPNNFLSDRFNSHSTEFRAANEGSLYRESEINEIDSLMAATLGFGNKIEAISTLKGFALYEDHSANEKNTKHEELLKMCQTPNGSRSIQYLIQTSLSDSDQIFEAIKRNIEKISKNAFGNYVIQDLLVYGNLECKWYIFDKIEKFINTLAFHKYGSRVVQKAIETAEPLQQKRYATKLKESLLAAITDRNATHVMQTLFEHNIEIFYNIAHRPDLILFYAKNIYGSRAVQKMLLLFEGPPREQLVQQIANHAKDLICDPFGNYVLQTAIQLGLAGFTSQICRLLFKRFAFYCRDKNGSNVMEACFAHVSKKDQNEMIHKMVKDSEKKEAALVSLVKDRYGNYVLQKIIDGSDARQRKLLVEALRREFEGIQSKNKKFFERIVYSE